MTRYELQVDSGVKLDKLDGYSRNLMAGLAARSIRIIAPIPGNGESSPVCLRGIRFPLKLPTAFACFRVVTTVPAGLLLHQGK